METFAATVFVICDEILLALNVEDDHQAQMSNFQPGSQSDSNILWKMELDIPQDSIAYADGAYNCFELEDILGEEQIHLLAKRGSRAKKRIRSNSEEITISSERQIVEAAFKLHHRSFSQELKISN